MILQSRSEVRIPSTHPTPRILIYHHPLHPWRYTCSNFSTSSAADVFQNVIQGVLAGLPGVLNLSDDILIYAATIGEHHARLRGILQRIPDAGLPLHKEKSEFMKQQIRFFGHTLSAAGVALDPEKVKDLQSAPSPTTISEVQSFLGIVNYCGRFIPNVTSLT